MKSLVANGNRIIHRLDDGVKNIELLGRMEKIALQAFRDNPEVERVTVTLNGKEKTSLKQDFLESPDTTELLS